MLHTTEGRVNRADTENIEGDSNVIGLKILNNNHLNRRSSQQPSKRSSDKKPSRSKKRTGKSKTRKIISTTSRNDEDTEAEPSEPSTTTTETTSNTPLEDKEAKASEESRSAKNDDAGSVYEDFEEKATDLDVEPKFRMTSVPKKNERVVKNKESPEDGKEYLRNAFAETERTTYHNMEERLDRLISKLLKESEDAEKETSTNSPLEFTGRKAQIEGPRAIIHSRCDTAGSSCYNPLQQILHRVNSVIPALIDEFPHRVIIQPRFRSIIYH